MNFKGSSGEGLKGNDEHIFGHWKKRGPCYKVAETWLNYVLLLGGK